MPGRLHRTPARLARTVAGAEPVAGRPLQDTRTAAPTARPRPATVALIALDGNIPLPRLGAALQAHLSIAVLGDAGAPAATVPGEPAAAYGPLLDRAEAGHKLVLLAGGPAWPAEPWIRFCLRQADRILAVTGADRSRQHWPTVPSRKAATWWRTTLRRGP